MKTLCSLLLCALLSIQGFAVQGQPPEAPSQVSSQSKSPAAAPAQATTPATNTRPLPALVGFGLEDGTPVKLRLTRNLSSATDKKGDTVDFEVLEDVVANGITVVPRGGVAW